MTSKVSVEQYRQAVDKRFAPLALYDGFELLGGDYDFSISSETALVQVIHAISVDRFTTPATFLEDAESLAQLMESAAATIRRNIALRRRK